MKNGDFSQMRVWWTPKVQAPSPSPTFTVTKVSPKLMARVSLVSQVFLALIWAYSSSWDVGLRSRWDVDWCRWLCCSKAFLSPAMLFEIRAKWSEKEINVAFRRITKGKQDLSRAYEIDLLLHVLIGLFVNERLFTSCSQISTNELQRKHRIELVLRQRLQSIRKPETKGMTIQLNMNPSWRKG